MTQAHTEGNLLFSFPDDWTVIKFDSSRFYLKQWQSFASGCKGVDFIACGPDCDVWFIEVKDYRQASRTKPSDLFEEVAQKVRDSLAALKVLAYRMTDSEEVALARKVLKGSRRFRIVLHLEQPAKPSKIFQQVIDPKTAQHKIRQKLRVIDPHCLVGDKSYMNHKVGWQVSAAQAGGTNR